MPSLSDGISIDSELVWHRFVRKHQASAWVGWIIIKLHKYPIYCFFIDVSLVPSIGPRSLRPNMTRYFLIPPSSSLQVSKPLVGTSSLDFLFCLFGSRRFNRYKHRLLSARWDKNHTSREQQKSRRFHLFTTIEKSWNHLSREKETGKFSPAIQSHSVDGITISRLAIGPRADQFSLALASKISRLRQSSQKRGKDAIKVFSFLFAKSCCEARK